MPRLMHAVQTISLLFVTATVAFISCQSSGNKSGRKIEPSFYYWKSVVDISPYEQQRMTDLSVSRLYIRFFDLGWNSATKQPAPLATVRFSPDDSAVLQNLQVIPVVFITEECLRNMDSSMASQTAARIVKLVRQILLDHKLQQTGEWQIDCDWTAGTRDIYFYFLRELQKLDTSISYSATIRLHQLKFISRSGVPPVKRGLLMCYNMGNLRNPRTTNSILDPAEMRKYIGTMNDYPLPLDLALPLFDWSVLFRQGVYEGLIKLQPDQLPPGVLEKLDANWYRVLADTVIRGYPCLKDDRLRYEQSSHQDLLAAARALSATWKDREARVSFFHLDDIILHKYSTDELQAIIHSLR